MSDVVDASQPGLFDLPATEPPRSARRPLRGRNRETWALTASAEVTIVDAEALLQAAAHAEENIVMIRPDVEDTEGEDADAQPTDLLYILGWLIWPTDGMEEPMEAGAFRVLSTESAVEPQSDDCATVTWTVIVKLTDVAEVRRLAAQARPDSAELIEDSFAAAWQCAADPFAPLQSIQGIAWRPGPVTVEHVPAGEVWRR